MPAHAVIGVKPDLANHLANQPLLDLTREVLQPGGKIHLVSLVAVGTNSDEHQRLDIVTKQTEGLAEGLRADGYDVTVTVQISTIGLGTELARIAEREGADLLVIGLAKRSRVGKALLGSDAQSAFMHAPCPVLATRLT